MFKHCVLTFALKWLLGLLCPVVATADDWPCFRGPRYDGISSETIDPSKWAEAGPTVIWRQSVGLGMSGVVVSDGRVYTMGNEGNVDTVFCFDATTGQSIWMHTYACATDPNEFDGGPTATPTIDVSTKSVFTISRSGDVFCLDAVTGKVRWGQPICEPSSIRIPAWGFAGSPFVYRDRVLLNVGDAGVCLDQGSGELVWASEDKDAGYSSMVPITVQGQDAVAFGSSRSYVCVDPKDGRELWRERWLTTFGCNAADPVLCDGNVFLSSGYNRGCAMLQIDGEEPEVLWKHKEMQNQLSTSVLIDGHLYGIHGDVAVGASLRCISVHDGAVKWTSDGIRFGALSATDQHLMTLSDNGELCIVKAASDQFGLVRRHAVLEGKCWVAPVLANGRIYCRDAGGGLACIDVRGGAKR